MAKIIHIGLCSDKARRFAYELGQRLQFTREGICYTLIGTAADYDAFRKLADDACLSWISDWYEMGELA